jgi:hypothetical protein
MRPEAARRSSGGVASGAAMAAADGARDATGALLFPGGFAAVSGLVPVTVPDLATPLVYDRSRLYLVVRDDSSVEMSDQFRFDFDATTFRSGPEWRVPAPPQARPSASSRSPPRRPRRRGPARARPQSARLVVGQEAWPRRTRWCSVKRWITARPSSAHPCRWPPARAGPAGVG